MMQCWPLCCRLGLAVQPAQAGVVVDPQPACWMVQRLRRLSAAQRQQPQQQGMGPLCARCGCVWLPSCWGRALRGSRTRKKMSAPAPVPAPAAGRASPSLRRRGIAPAARHSKQQLARPTPGHHDVCGPGITGCACACQVQWHSLQHADAQHWRPPPGPALALRTNLFLINRRNSGLSEISTLGCTSCACAAVPVQELSRQQSGLQRKACACAEASRTGTHMSP
jgi:hypothetical protein